MYVPFYGLRERPFDLTPNPRYLYFSPSHREALGNLEYGISAQKGVTLLLGEAGTGKTTLVRAALAAQHDRNSLCVYLNNPTLTRREFVTFLADSFELGAAAATSKAVCLRELEQMLRSRWEAGRVTALVIDEAQSLSHELLEEVRLLANIETDTAKLLSLVLVGQLELAARLNEGRLRQLKQRVALRCSLTPLDHSAAAAYISARIEIAGGECGRLFTPEAVAVVSRAAQGIPRMINVICDNALVNGFAAEQRPVDEAIVLDVCRDFDLALAAPEARDAAGTVAAAPGGEP